MEDDTRQRLRRLEERSSTHGEDIAHLKASVDNQGQLVRAMAPLIPDLATVRGVANSAKEGADNANKRIDDVEDRLDTRHRFNLSQGIVLAGTVISLVALIVLIIQLSSA